MAPRAIIADDERLMREQLRTRLAEAWPQLEVVVIGGKIALFGHTIHDGEAIPSRGYSVNVKTGAPVNGRGKSN